MMASAWKQRCVALSKLKRHSDALRSAAASQQLAGTSDCQAEAQRAQGALGELIGKMSGLLGVTGSPTATNAQRLGAWRSIEQLDPTSLTARTHVAADRLQEAVRLRSSAASDEQARSRAIAAESLNALRRAAADLQAYQAGEAAEQQPGPHASIEAVLSMKLANVPLAAFGARVVKRLEAFIHLNTGLALEHVDEAEVEAEAEEASATVPFARTAGCAHARAVRHYQRAAQLDASGSRPFELWAGAALQVRRLADGSAPSGAERRALAEEAHRAGVAAGVWALPLQRPVQLIRGLAAQPWHATHAHAACHCLEANYDLIKAEAMALLRADADAAVDAADPSSARAASPVFTPYDSKALACGEWADLGLYFNGRRNDANARRAPKTSALLGSDAGGLRADGTSCPLGSAYFSLLRPRTTIASHCGPTNARLRAHLALVVPEEASTGDDDEDARRCGLTVGGVRRPWREGRVLLFDDSFEHDALNTTAAPRLVLIVDLWHPGLDTDEKRLAALDEASNRQIYLDVVRKAKWQNTTERGH